MRSQIVSTKLQQIAKQAKDDPGRVFTNLAHLMDEEFLREAYRRTRKDGSVGVDGVTGAEYAQNLNANIKDLHERLRTRKYQATPVKRVWLEKLGGGQRPIGIPAFEDKIVQRAVTMLMGAVYEQDFHPFSHGFREGHSAHHALQGVREHCMQQNIGWIVDADVSEFFDSLDHSWLREIIRRRINDGSLLKLIGKWLNAGVVDGKSISHPDSGTPQGGVISPVLANIFLHHVLDDWYVKEVKPRLKGRSFLTRFADDFTIGCEREEDARRVMEVLPKRFGRFGLTIHPSKTTLVKFSRPRGSGEPGGGGNGTFDFLGFTHYWTKSRRGYWVIKRKTSKKRLQRAMKGIWQWCEENRHEPLKSQWDSLRKKLSGYYQYYGIRGNYRALDWVFKLTERAWQYWLNRRSRKGAMPWAKFQKLKQVIPLPTPKIVHNV